MSGCIHPKHIQDRVGTELCEYCPHRNGECLDDDFVGFPDPTPPTMDDLKGDCIHHYKTGCSISNIGGNPEHDKACAGEKDCAHFISRGGD